MKTPAALKSPKPHRGARRGFGKYGVAAKEDRTHYGVVYDSKREMEIAQQYEMLLRTGDLAAIERQVRFPLVVNGVKIAVYVADLRLRWANGLIECVEIKGVWTPVARLKMKLMKALYPNETIRIVN